ncbi:MAG TPA: adenylate/guanylate cyclase domain-containing protein [Bryobacteraceae bacterium]|nr:adenylate/guanylate cyclase domain-containing protein [Bryobacteraceae bacterium]
MPETSLVLERSGRSFPLTGGQTWAIGRGDGCAVLLDSRSVSRLHALIQRREAGDYSLVDLGSRNGSFVNGRRVSLPTVLNDRDRLMVGDQELVFRAAAPWGVSPARPNVNAPGTDSRNLPTTALHTHTLTTIVVVDIRDFTPLARSIPEAVLSQSIGTWFLRAGQIVQRQGSWAQKYIGDAVMAVWIHDNQSNLAPDLMRALRAVSEIDGVTAGLHRTLPLPGPLRIGAGVNTGPAIVGGSDFTALGDTVNAAFRLEAATKQLGLGVALGERTFEELRLAEAAPFLRREVELKGYDAPSTAWAVSFAALAEFLTATSTVGSV